MVETNALYAAVSRQANLEQRIIQITHDMTNANSPGHKAKKMIEVASQQKTGFNEYVAFAENAGFIRDTRQGRFQPTGDPLHVAIQGDGHFNVLATVEGQQVNAHTRDGVFIRGNDGSLRTGSGAQVLDDGGAPILLPAGAGPITVTSDGTVMHGDTVISRIGVTQYKNDNLMQDIGNNLYITGQAPQEGGRYVVESGGYEASNVEPVVATTELVKAFREYERLEKYNKLLFDQMKSANENLMVAAPVS